MVWEAFGENTNQLLAFEVNISSGNTKQSFIKWLNKWNATISGVAPGEGGTRFATAIYGNGTRYGGPKYIIKPNRKFVRTYNPEADLLALGVKKGNKEAILTKKESTLNSALIVEGVTSEVLTLGLQNNSSVQISISQLNGRQIATINRDNLSAGTHEISLREIDLAHGVFILRISTGTTEVNHLFVK